VVSVSSVVQLLCQEMQEDRSVNKSENFTEILCKFEKNEFQKREVY